MKKRKLFLIATTAIMLIMAACSGSFVDPGTQDSNNGNISGGGSGGGGNNGGGGIGGNGGSGKGGTFTLTDIPSEYNGMYAGLHGWGTPEGIQSVQGDNNFNTITGVTSYPRILNGSVSIPMWIFKGSSFSRYSGYNSLWVYVGVTNQQNLSLNEDSSNYILKVTIIMANYETIAFKSGNATISWEDADNYYEGF